MMNIKNFFIQTDLHHLQLRFFMRDHLPQELLLQTSRCHCEVYKRGLRLKLRGKVRVGVFSV